MSKLYVYDTDTMELAIILHGEQSAVERYFDEHYDTDTYGCTYTPAFGSNDGLIDNNDAEEFDVLSDEEQGYPSNMTEADILTAQQFDISDKPICEQYGDYRLYKLSDEGFAWYDSEGDFIQRLETSIHNALCFARNYLA